MKAKNPRLLKPTDNELAVLNVLWDRGPATVREVHEDLQQVKRSQYTTTLRLMQIMASKGLLARNETERAHVYAPTVDRVQVQRAMTTRLIDRVFGGSAESLLVGMLGAKRASTDELARMRQRIEEHERRRKP
jgi:predicted transcriptional regulator